MTFLWSACSNPLLVQETDSRLSNSQKPSLLLQASGLVQPQVNSQPGPTLQNISLTLSRGSLTVLHGEVGAGQSVAFLQHCSTTTCAAQMPGVLMLNCDNHLRSSWLEFGIKGSRSSR